MDIGDVIREMKAHPEKRFARFDWNGKNQYVMVQMPDMNSKMTLPYIFLRNAQGEFVPWQASQGDIFATDWAYANEDGSMTMMFGPKNGCRFDNQPNPKSDAVHSPAHYTKGRRYEPWDVILDWELDYLTGTAVKYIARAGRKQQAGMTMKQSEEQDIMKAIEYLQRKLEQIRRRD